MVTLAGFQPLGLTLLGLFIAFEKPSPSLLLAGGPAPATSPPLTISSQPALTSFSPAGPDGQRKMFPSFRSQLKETGPGAQGPGHLGDRPKKRQSQTHTEARRDGRKLGQASALAVTCWVTHLNPDLLWVWAAHLLNTGWLCSCGALGNSPEVLGQWSPCCCSLLIQSLVLW